jgi:hypothetical protein
MEEVVVSHPSRPTPREEGTMTDEETAEKKGGFFRKLLKLAFIGAIVAAVVQFVKRRRGSDLDDTEWQELPPPAGG